MDYPLGSARTDLKLASRFDPTPSVPSAFALLWEYQTEQSGKATTIEDDVRRLSYDPLTGAFIWAKGAFAGKPAGCLDSKGYISLHIGTKQIRAHRVAWFLTHGQWPAMIDHINGDKTDNRIANLRVCNVKQNAANTLPHPMRGVSPSRDKYRARIRLDGRSIHLGLFDTANEAADAYHRARMEHFGEFARQRPDGETEESDE